jgi:hypothetical protein
MRDARRFSLVVSPGLVEGSNHEQERSSSNRPVLSKLLILRQAQDERRVERFAKAARNHSRAPVRRRIVCCVGLTGWVGKVPSVAVSENCPSGRG